MVLAPLAQCPTGYERYSTGHKKNQALQRTELPCVWKQEAAGVHAHGAGHGASGAGRSL